MCDFNIWKLPPYLPQFPIVKTPLWQHQIFVVVRNVKGHFEKDLLWNIVFEEISQ